MKLFTIILLSILLRCSLILLASHFQTPQHLTLTDIDYKIYSQSAQSILHGLSPYTRHTYRYSPLISYLLTFNHHLSIFSFTKYLFVLFDIIAILLLKRATQNTQAGWQLPVKLYAFNPLFIYLTARGSIQGINSVLFLACYLLLKGKREGWAGVVYGVWVHFRVYPVIFGITILKYISGGWKGWRKVVNFLVTAGVTFGVITGVFYWMYGFEFIQETYLYHFTRVDNRHNLSVYFYNTYLHMLQPQNFIHSLLPPLLTLYLFKQIHSRFSHNLQFSLFYLSSIFILFNKVLTVQYYMWSHLPLLLLISYSKWWEFRNWRAAMHSYAVWVLGVMVWVWLAMQLEGWGKNVFRMMWIGCVGRFVGESWVLGKLGKYWRWEEVEKGRFEEEGEEKVKNDRIRDVKEKKKV